MTVPNASEDSMTLYLSYIADENVKWHGHSGK